MDSQLRMLSTTVVVNLNEPLCVKYGDKHFETFSSSDYDFSLPFGMYQVSIKPYDNPEGAYAIFSIAKNCNSCNCKYTRINSMPGKYREQLDVSWGENENLKIYYRPAPKKDNVFVGSNDYSRRYIVRITE